MQIKTSYGKKNNMRRCIKMADTQFDFAAANAAVVPTTQSTVQQL
jgi:hypothetical protein